MPDEGKSPAKKRGQTAALFFVVSFASRPPVRLAAFIFQHMRNPRVIQTPQLQRRRLMLGMALGATATAARAQSNLVDSEGRPAGAMEAPYIPTPGPVVEAMLDLAGVTAKDVVYDLGCGDGRIVITAARARGARGVGIEIDVDLVERARVAARQAGVADRVRIDQGDLFALDLREATVVMLYLGEDLNTKLWPKLKRELRPGTRIVSHRFIIRDVPPKRSIEAHGVALHFWTI